MGKSFIDASAASNMDELKSVTSYLKSILSKVCFQNVASFVIFGIVVMQVVHHTQCSSNNWSIKRNTCLHFWQFENKIFEITYSTILNNQESIITRYQNEIYKIQS